MTMTKEHQIETLTDLIEAARDTDDRDGLFEDLRVFVDTFLEFPENSLVKMKPIFVWNDDNVRGVRGARIDYFDA